MMPRTVLVIVAYWRRDRPSPKIALGYALTIFDPPSRGRWIHLARNRASMLVAPDLAVGKEEQARERQQKRHHAEPESLALFHPGLRRPSEKRHHIVRFLVEFRRRAVGESHGTVGERRRHGDIPVLEIRIVVFVRQHLEP